MRLSRRLARGFALFWLTVALFPGCRSNTPSPAQPEKARETLQTVLTAWQNGDSVESLGKRNPAITASDPRWRDGVRLLRYEIAADSTPSGYDLQFHVALWVEEAGGKKTQENVVYTVSTSPKLVVLREN